MQDPPEKAEETETLSANRGKVGSSSKLYIHRYVCIYILLMHYNISVFTGRFKGCCLGSATVPQGLVLLQCFCSKMILTALMIIMIMVMVRSKKT